MNEQKIQNIIKLSKEDRYRYFINKVVDFEEIWGLFNDGWAVLGDNSESEVIPFWPEKAFAERCISDKWQNFSAKVISLSDFIEKWLPGMERDNRLAGVFYIPELKENIIISPGTLRADLIDEQEQY